MLDRLTVAVGVSLVLAEKIAHAMDESFIKPKLVKQFANWLEHFDTQHATAWALLLRNNPQAAMCEATFWGILTDCGVQVAPNLDLKHGGQAPDFVCHQNGHKFYVEVTCIEIEAATRKTALEHIPEQKAQCYSNLNEAIFEKCRRKREQCENLDAPSVVAVGTFHYHASAVAIQPHHLESLLTGTPYMAWDINRATGQGVGDAYQVTRLERSLFIRPGEASSIEFARIPISALLVGAFGTDPPAVYGLLHPAPQMSFDPTILRRIAFCKQNIDFMTGTVSVEWLQKTDAMHAGEFS